MPGRVSGDSVIGKMKNFELDEHVGKLFFWLMFKTYKVWFLFLWLVIKLLEVS